MLYKKNFRRSFDDNDLYIHITRNTKMSEAFIRSDIYVINQIIFDIDEVALIANVMTINENELI